jgi:hypothetical protein
VAESGAPDDDAETRDPAEALAADLVDDDDDLPAPETGLGALFQLLLAVVAVAALLLILVGGAAMLARLFR